MNSRIPSYIYPWAIFVGGTFAMDICIPLIYSFYLMKLFLRNSKLTIIQKVCSITLVSPSSHGDHVCKLCFFWVNSLRQYFQTNELHTIRHPLIIPKYQSFGPSQLHLDSQIAQCLSHTCHIHVNYQIIEFDYKVKACWKHDDVIVMDLMYYGYKCRNKSPYFFEEGMHNWAGIWHTYDSWFTAQ